MRLAPLGIDLCARRLPVCRHDYRADVEIRWDWLEPLVTVPYVPTLGLAHPAAITPGLFMEVIGIAGTGGSYRTTKTAAGATARTSTSSPDPSPRNPAWSSFPAEHPPPPGRQDLRLK